MVAESARVERASGRAGFDVEPEEHFRAAKTLQRDDGAIVRRESEIRCRRSRAKRHLPSVEQGAKLLEGGHASGIARRALECALEFLDRAIHHPLCRIDSAEIHEWKMARVVTRRLLRFLEPLDRRVQFALRDQISADVVVRISKAW